jgi:hypothetical protein
MSEIERLAEAIANAISKQNSIPIEYAYWDAEVCAQYLGVAKTYFLNEIKPHPKFPKPSRLPTASGNRTHPRWRAMDVIGYTDLCKVR